MRVGGSLALRLSFTSYGEFIGPAPNLFCNLELIASGDRHLARIGSDLTLNFRLPFGVDKLTSHKNLDPPFRTPATTNAGHNFSNSSEYASVPEYRNTDTRLS